MFYPILSIVLILLAVAGGLYIPRILNKREHQKFEQFRHTLLSSIRGFGVDMQLDDIRIQMKSKKNVDYILNVYEGRDVVMVKTIEKNLQRMISERFSTYRMRISTDFKKHAQRNSETA